MRNYLILLIISVGFFSCGPKSSCEEYNEDAVEITFQSNMNTRYPDFPEGMYVLGSINGIYVTPTTSGVEYELTNEQYKMNDVIVDPNFPSFSENVGTNIVTYTGDCSHANKNGFVVCDCSSKMMCARTSIEMIDTVQLWIKKIEFSKQYQSQGIGGKPNVYLTLNNFDLKSNTTTNFDLASMGRKVWEINDTFAISREYFNMSITSWDRDRFSKDDVLDKYLITYDQINNWETGIDTVNTGLGTFILDVEKL